MGLPVFIGVGGESPFKCGPLYQKKHVQTTHPSNQHSTHAICMPIPPRTNTLLRKGLGVGDLTILNELINAYTRNGSLQSRCPKML